MHPDQFVVLSSDSPEVVANSVKILQMHADIMDLLQQPRSPWALLEIHGGKANRSDALVERIAELPDAIRLRLCLENDEYAYNAEQIHDICMRSGVPMVFDAHHHIVSEKLSSYDDPSVAEMLAKARETWPDAGAPAGAHLERPRRLQRPPARRPDLHHALLLRPGALDRDRGQEQGRGDRRPLRGWLQ
jgi:UV DNA damage repair endonuclease